MPEAGAGCRGDSFEIAAAQDAAPVFHLFSLYKLSTAKGYREVLGV